MTTAEQVVDFLAECYRKDYELDSDDICEILAGNFDYVRKQYGNSSDDEREGPLR